MMTRELVKSFDIAARIAVLIFAVALFSVFIVATAKQAFAAELKSEGIISDDYIRLGDIFEGTKNAEYVLGPAPAPGKEMILNAKTLYKIASALDVDWKPNSAAEQIILRRDAAIIPESEITTALEQKLKESGVDDKFSIAYINTPADIALPAGSDETLEITSFNFDPQADRFTAVIVAPSADNPLKKATVTGRIERLLAVPVLRNSLKAGDIIGAMDLDWIDLPENKIPNGTAMSEKDLIDMTPKRMAAAGKPIFLNDLVPPQMVDRGDAVTLIFEAGKMTLTAKGKALQAGAMGDTVRVANTDSNKNLQGVVTAHREITIR